MKTISRTKIKIEFEYTSGNDDLVKMIYQIGKNLNVKGIVKKENDRILIYLEDSIEKVEKFSDELGNKLPFSIFLGNANISEVKNILEEIDEDFRLIGEINTLPQNLSLCPSCLKELLDPTGRRFYYPFISCNYCGSHYSYLYEYPFKRERTVFKFFQPCGDCLKEKENPLSFRYNYQLISCHKCLTPIYLKKGENERYGFDGNKTLGAVKTAAGVIKKGELLRIYTSQGEKVIGLVTEENIRKVRNFLNLGRKNLTLLITNTKSLKDIAFISESELKALASREKPVVNLQAKQFMEKELISLKTGFLKVKLPDEPLLFLLSLHLKEEGIDFVFIENIEKDYQKEITEFELNADLPVVNKQKNIEINVVQGKFLILQGEKGIFPNIIKAKETGNLSISGNYAAVDLGNGEYLIDKKEKILYQLPDFVDKLKNANVLNGEFEDIKVPYKTKKSFKPFEGAILSALAEYNKLEESAVGIYFSSKFNEDVIALKSNLKPLKPLIKIKPVKIFKNFNKTVKWALDEIENSSEEGKRLIKNYKLKFPEIYNNFKNLETTSDYKEASSITAVLNIASVLLGIHPYEDVSYFEEPYHYLQTESLDFTGNQGLMVDFFLEEENLEFNLNWIKMIQSVLSYKIAGVDNKMIAFSIFEGLGDWIIKETEKISKKIKIKNIALTGNFFGNQVLTGRIIKHFGGKYNILINRKLPIDEQNIVFGGIFV